MKSTGSSSSYLRACPAPAAPRAAGGSNVQLASYWRRRKEIELRNVRVSGACSTFGEIICG